MRLSSGVPGWGGGRQFNRRKNGETDDGCHSIYPTGFAAPAHQRRRHAPLAQSKNDASMACASVLAQNAQLTEEGVRR